MTLYLVAGAGAPFNAPEAAAAVRAHLPSRRTRRYPSDTTDAEWAVLAWLVPAGGPGCRGGRRPAHPRRDIVDAIRYIAHNGGVWRALPADFPPWQTVYDYHRRWTADGTVNRIHNVLREQVRTAEGRHREPSAAIVDSQSVRAAETVARTQRGYDAGKGVNGRKRHIAVDTMGLLVAVVVTAANVSDGRGACQLLEQMTPEKFPRLQAACGDGRYNDKRFIAALERRGLALEVKGRPPGAKGFVLIKKRWIVERTFAWLGFNRRLSKDYERTVASSETRVRIAAIGMMLRRLTKKAA